MPCKGYEADRACQEGLAHGSYPYQRAPCQILKGYTAYTACTAKGYT